MNFADVLWKSGEPVKKPKPVVKQQFDRVLKNLLSTPAQNRTRRAGKKSMPQR
jgi:hypothetical protein